MEVVQDDVWTPWGNATPIPEVAVKVVDGSTNAGLVRHSPEHVTCTCA